jgi:16S rRNA processing protein RimM
VKTEFFRVGVISSAHGIKGELNVFPTCEDPSRFKKLKTVYLGEGGTVLTVESVKFFKNMVILKVKEIPDRTEAEKYRNKELYVDRANAVPLKEGEYYISDILGSTVITDEGEELGTLVNVMQTGANDVFEVQLKNDKKTVLLPKIDDCVLKVDAEKGEILVHMMKGLL